MSSQIDFLQFAVCGHCTSKLDVHGDDLHCPRCQCNYPVRRGIPFLGKLQDYEFGEIAIDLPAFLAEVDARGWDIAFESLLASLPPKQREYHRQYVTDSRRGAWRFLTDIKPDGVAVDFGCGWGINAFSLAQSFRTVIGLDLSESRLRAAAHRRSALQLPNVLLMQGGDTKHIPLADQSVDLFALNGVLEYLALGREGDPRKCQVEFLRDVHRVLKPDGQVYVGIENRYGRCFIFGEPDHPRTKFTSIMPRWLADAYCRRKIGQPYRWYTYGYYELQSLLREAGFATTEMYSAHPHYSDFTHHFPLNDMRGPIHALRPRSWKGRLGKWVFTRLDAFKYLADSFAAVGSKQPTSRSFIARLGDEVPGRDRQDSAPRPTYMQVAGTGKTVAYYCADGATQPQHIALLPLTRDETQRLGNTGKSLAQVHGIPGLPESIRKLVPRAEKAGRLNGQPYLFENCLPGMLAFRGLGHPEFRVNIIQSATAFLVEFGRATAQTETFDRQLLAELVLPELDEARIHHPDHFSPALHDRCVEFANKTLAGHALPIVSSHGDFGPQHLFAQMPSGEITGVIDWEFMRQRDWPLLDLLTALIHVELETGAKDHSEALLRVLHQNTTTTPACNAIAKYCADLNVDRNVLGVIAIVYIFRHLHFLRDYPVWRYAATLTALDGTLKQIMDAPLGRS